MSGKIIDLFSGIGGFSLGLERAGFETAAFCEFDPKARAVLHKHWPFTPIYDDIRGFNATPYKGKIEIVCGGDPCQRNSNAWRHGRGDPSPAGHFIRVVAECRPRFVLRENPSVVRKDAPWPWWKFRRSLERLGYAVLPFKLRSCCVGGSSRRERLLLLATLPDSDSQGLEGHVREILERKIKRGQNTHFAGSDRGHPAPRICRKGDGIPGRVDRLKQLGNAVDPEIPYRLGLAIKQIQEAGL